MRRASQSAEGEVPTMRQRLTRQRPKLLHVYLFWQYLLELRTVSFPHNKVKHSSCVRRPSRIHLYRSQHLIDQLEPLVLARHAEFLEGQVCTLGLRTSHRTKERQSRQI